MLKRFFLATLMVSSISATTRQLFFIEEQQRLKEELGCAIRQRDSEKFIACLMKAKEGGVEESILRLTIKTAFLELAEKMFPSSADEASLKEVMTFFEELGVEQSIIDTLRDKISGTVPSIQIPEPEAVLEELVVEEVSSEEPDVEVVPQENLEEQAEDDILQEEDIEDTDLVEEPEADVEEPVALQEEVIEPQEEEQEDTVLVEEPEADVEEPVVLQEQEEVIVLQDEESINSVERDNDYGGDIENEWDDYDESVFMHPKEGSPVLKRVLISLAALGGVSLAAYFGDNYLNEGKLLKWLKDKDVVKRILALWKKETTDTKLADNKS